MIKDPLAPAELPEDVIIDPPDNWVTHLIPNNVIYLVKERQKAVVQAPYRPEYDRCGILLIQSYSFAHIDKWFVRPNGCGIDGSLLMLPIKGEYDDQNSIEVSNEFARLRSEIAGLKKEIFDLRLLVLNPIRFDFEF